MKDYKQIKKRAIFQTVLKKIMHQDKEIFFVFILILVERKNVSRKDVKKRSKFIFFMMPNFV